MKIPKITSRGFVNEKELRFYAVFLSHSKEDNTVSLPLANAITEFILNGTWNAGMGYEKEYLDLICGKPTDPAR